MKTMGGRFFRKLKSLPNISSLRQGLFPRDHLSSSAEKYSYGHVEHHKREHLPEELVDEFGVAEHFTDVEDDDDDDDELSKGSQKKAPSLDNLKPPVSSETDVERDDAKEDEKDVGDGCVSLSDFEAKCPPGGSGSIILYTTSMTSIRKTFEDCRNIRFLLASFKVVYYERDVSMHLEYREELWSTMGDRVIPPRVFIKGRYIGGADQVISLHERGKLKKLMQGIPMDLSTGHPCNGCGNMRFVVCSNCNGSRKVFPEEENTETGMIRCPECNENGLVKCSSCSC